MTVDWTPLLGGGITLVLLVLVHSCWLKLTFLWRLEVWPDLLRAGVSV